MNKRFYVDIAELNSYSNFLRKCMNEVNKQVELISKANNQYQSVIKDNISTQVDLHIKKLKKVFDNFSIELDNMSKQTKKDFELYQAYLKGLK